MKMPFSRNEHFHRMPLIQVALQLHWRNFRRWRTYSMPSPSTKKNDNEKLLYNVINVTLLSVIFLFYCLVAYFETRRLLIIAVRVSLRTTIFNYGFFRAWAKSETMSEKAGITIKRNRIYYVLFILLLINFALLSYIYLRFLRGAIRSPLRNDAQVCTS